MNVLIVGGTSGLGLELARLLVRDNHEVIVTGRNHPGDGGVTFVEVHLDERLDELKSALNMLSSVLSSDLGMAGVNLLIYSAGFFQPGKITDLLDGEIHDMTMVGLVAPAMILRRILLRQGYLDGFIAITSTSEWTPRLDEPIYAASKAGLAMFGRSVSLDERIGKTLVAGPAGMKTKFWEGTDKDTTTMLDPAWVAEQILDLYLKDDFVYRHARILRDPARVEYETTMYR